MGHLEESLFVATSRKEAAHLDFLTDLTHFALIIVSFRFELL